MDGDVCSQRKRSDTKRRSTWGEPSEDTSENVDESAVLLPKQSSLQSGRRPTNLPWQNPRRSTWGGVIPSDNVQVTSSDVHGSVLSRGHRPDLAFLAKEEVHTVTWREIGKDMLSSNIFQIVIATLILGNAIVIGLETDVPSIANFPALEFAFLCAFAVEMSARLFLFRGEYFDRLSPEFYWNMFDFTVVLLGIVDTVADAFIATMNISSVTTLFRMVRLLRVLRLIRIIRFLKTLYVLSVGLIEASVAVFWVALLFCVILYVCSIVIVRSVDFRKGQDFSTSNSMLQERFANIHLSMMMLFEVLSHKDIKRSERMDLLGHDSAVDFMIVGFTIFGSFGLTALLTGLINQGMFEKNQVRLEEERQEREAKLEIVSDHCGALFDEAETTADGKASKQELVLLIPFVEEMFNYNDVSYDPADLAGVIGSMDADVKGGVKKDEFCQCILSIADRGRPMSSMELQYSMTLVKMKLAKCLPLIQGSAESAYKIDSLLTAASKEERELHERTKEAEALQMTLNEKSQASVNTMNGVLDSLLKVDEAVQYVVKSQERLESHCKASLQDVQGCAEVLRKQVRLVDHRVDKAVVAKKHQASLGGFPGFGGFSGFADQPVSVELSPLSSPRNEKVQERKGSRGEDPALTKQVRKAKAQRAAAASASPN
eukprot:TRINITY_DN5343_c0_g1_i1.p1 TRINITY_DN5343_c0_g1~~TRINITY_DN5343_c0_g1_i1.p1  ORF type:complete len:684 (-),score=118.16 TRINITY_DN5343_c0_g1_i1:85-2058(-)